MTKSPTQRTVLIAGGTGLIGRYLRCLLESQGHVVRVLSRRADATDEHRYTWDVKAGTMDRAALLGVDSIVHLAGAGIADERWTPRRRQLIIDSRVRSTELLMKILQSEDHQVDTMVIASGVGYYGMVTRDEPYSEGDAAGQDFLGETCVRWEEASEPLSDMGIRRVVLRTGVVLANESGAYPKFRQPLKMGVAPVLGSGRQYVPWIHIEDISRIYAEAILNEQWSGIYNAAAPQHVRMSELMSTIRDEVARLVPKLPVPSWALRLGLGAMSEMLVEGSPVSVDRLLGEGFNFNYPLLNGAVRALESDKYHSGESRKG